MKPSSPQTGLALVVIHTSSLFHAVSDADSSGVEQAPRAALVIPDGFCNDIKRVSQPTCRSAHGDTRTLRPRAGYTTAVLREASIPAAAAVTTRLAGIEPRIWYNPELRSTLFLVPGLIAYISMITAVVSTALSIVREKENGTMEQIRMSPISTPAFVAGKAAPYLLLSQLADAVIMEAMALFGSAPCGQLGWRSRSCWPSFDCAIGTGLLCRPSQDQTKWRLDGS